MSAGVLYKLENCKVELHNVFPISVGKIYNFFQSHICGFLVDNKNKSVHQFGPT